MVLRLSLYSPQSPWWSSDYSYTHHSLLGGTQTIPILITVSLVALRLSLYSSQSTYWLRQSLYSSQSPWLYSDFTFTHHSLSGGPQTIPTLITVYLVTQTISILITVSLMVLRLTLYSSQNPWCNSDYPFNHHSLSGGPQTIPILITVSIVVLRLSLYSSQSPLWYSDYPYTHHSKSSCWSSVYPYPHHILFGGTQTKPIRIIVSLVVLGISPYTPQSTWWLRQSLYSSQSPSWYPGYPFSHHSLPGGTQTIHILITVSLEVLRLSLCSSQSPW